MPDIDEVRTLFEAVMRRDHRVLQRIEDCSAEA